MPRCFFDIHDGQSLIRDDVGQECEGREGIRHEAMKVLPSIARDVIPSEGDKQAFTVMVRNENNTVLYTATLTFAGLWLGDAPIPAPEPEE